MGVIFSKQSQSQMCLKVIKNELIQRKMKQSQKWQVICFGISALGAAFLAHWFFNWFQKLLSPVFYKKVGFGVCEICHKEQTDIIIKKCGHFSHCHECQFRKDKIVQSICPVCRKQADEIIRIYV